MISQPPRVHRAVSGTTYYNTDGELDQLIDALPSARPGS
jgi:hypothetical protein